MPALLEEAGRCKVLFTVLNRFGQVGAEMDSVGRN